jgi:DNA-binding NarL/FixJ family response regulator
MGASPQPGQAVRVVLAESNSIHAELLANAISRDRRLKVIYSTCSSSELLSRISRLQPDVLVLSASLDDHSDRGLDALENLRITNPNLKVIILLDRSHSNKVVNAFRSGARGVFCRNSPVKYLSKCIRVVHAGQIWASSEELGYVFQALAGTTMPGPFNSNISQLSNRERDVVRCLAEGMSNREIAQKLGISPYTVKNYMFKIFDRLGVSSRVELLFYLMSQSVSSNLSALLEPRPEANREKHASHEPQLHAKVLRPPKSRGMAAADFTGGHLGC